MMSHFFGSDKTAEMTARLRALRTRNDAYNHRRADPMFQHTAEADTARAYQGDSHIEWGPADNIGVFGSLGQAGGNIQPCMLRKLNMAPFQTNTVDASAVGPSGLYIADVLCSLRTGSASSKVQQVIAECLVPNWAADRCLREAEARAELMRLLANGAALADQGWFADVLMEMQRRRQMAAMAAAQAAAPGQRADGQDGVVPMHLICKADGGPIWNTMLRDWHGNPNDQNKLDFLMECMRGLGDRQRARAMYPVFLLILAFVTRGTISADKLERLKREMKEVLGALLDMLKPEDVRLTWDNFACCVRDGDAGAVFTRWEAYFTGNALIRLRVMITQAKGAGLTSLDIINRAIHKHPHFAWFAMRRMYPEEWEAARAATLAIGGNRYYGFKADLGVVKATLYRRLTWACQMLLVATGEDNLAKYKGFSKDESKREVINLLIDAYKGIAATCDLHAEVDQAENAAIGEYINLVAQYPSNVE